MTNIVGIRPSSMIRAVVSRALQRDQPARHQSERGEQQQRIQPQTPLARDERRRRVGGRLYRVGAQRVWELPTWKPLSFTSNHRSRINRAAGAAVSAPK